MNRNGSSAPFVIGIAGPSASGKTALACRVVATFGSGRSLRLPLDHYYRDLSALPPALRAAHNFDHPAALDHDRILRDLRALLGGEEISMPLYDFATHSRRPETRRARAGALLVVDGLHALYRDELRELLDLRVFLETDHVTCLDRRITRDTRERGRTEQSVRDQYERTVRPMYETFVAPTRRYADLLLRGEDPLDKHVDAVIAAIPEA